MKAAVIALGKIGLPLAVQIAGKGVPTMGADIAADVVDQVNRGRAPFPGETGLADRLKAVRDTEMLVATTSTKDAVEHADVVVVVVPVMTDAEGTADFRAIDAATDDIAEALRPGHLISYETTLPVGTTRNRFAVRLAERSGLVAGDDFQVVHSPERVFSGRIFRDLRAYPKLVGGIDPLSAERAVAFYERILDFDDRDDLPRPNGVWNLGSAEAAELAKLAETTYRDVNIALANEYARFAEDVGVDIHEVIAAANSQPFSHIHRPGVAVGGHCIPVYPRFYSSVDKEARLPVTARAVNESVPARVVARLDGALGGLSGKRIAILGAAYRGNVKEAAFSGAFPLASEIVSRGGEPMVHDPLFSDADLEQLGFTPFALGDRCDGAILQADHAEYLQLGPADLPGCAVVLDGRRYLDPEQLPGITYLAIGSG